jgi:hypothetical protein
MSGLARARAGTAAFIVLVIAVGGVAVIIGVTAC